MCTCLSHVYTFVKPCAPNSHRLHNHARTRLSACAHEHERHTYVLVRVPAGASWGVVRLVPFRVKGNAIAEPCVMVFVYKLGRWGLERTGGRGGQDGKINCIVCFRFFCMRACHSLCICVSMHYASSIVSAITGGDMAVEGVVADVGLAPCMTFVRSFVG